MTCAWLDQVLGETPTADALAHAKGCAECGPARAAWDAMKGEVATGSLEKAREAARAELRAAPRARSWFTDAWMLVAINFGVVAVASVALRAPVRQVEWPGSQWALAGALLALIGAGAWAAVRPGARLLRLGVIAAAVAGAVGIGLGGSGLGGDRPFASGLACAVTEVVVSVAPFAVALWATSRFAFDLSRAIVAGVSVGATGMFVLHLHCANGTAEHLFALHVLPWLGLAIGAVAIRRSMPSRSFAP